MASSRASLVLMGLRGSGKTTLGRLVADRAGLEFVDLDERTTAALGGGSVAELWAQHGEACFRAAESAALAAELDAAQEGARVLALGGGTPTAPGAADLLRGAVGAGTIMLVYLRGRPATLRARLSKTDVRGRPTLTGTGTLEEVEAVFNARDPLYRSLGGRVLEIDEREAADIADELAGLIG